MGRYASWTLNCDSTERKRGEATRKWSAYMCVCVEIIFINNIIIEQLELKDEHLNKAELYQLEIPFLRQKMQH